MRHREMSLFVLCERQSNRRPTNEKHTLTMNNRLFRTIWTMIRYAMWHAKSCHSISFFWISFSIIVCWLKIVRIQKYTCTSRKHWSIWIRTATKICLKNSCLFEFASRFSLREKPKHKENELNVGRQPTQINYRLSWVNWFEWCARNCAEIDQMKNRPILKYQFFYWALELHGTHYYVCVGRDTMFTQKMSSNNK